jgi:hypothetical protein
MADRFDSRKIDRTQAYKIRRITKEFEVLGEFAERVTLPSRYQSLGLTALEEAAMWFTKGISREEAEDE